ncbi:hypothetical protein [Hungatella effluvii]|uniref:hypothetical protein n=1 Tax=Hungatella effluvii TaxID=1096246 RepID=UPI0022E0A9E6|nr:hypothetical protein [Hungatella effluvii]
MSDITDYVLKESENYELKGPMTMAVLTNTFRKMFRTEDTPYVAVKRGYYMQDTKSVKGSSLTPFEKASKILEQAEERIKSCFVVKLVENELDVEGIKLMSRHGQAIGKLLQCALQEAEQGQQEIEEMKQKKSEGGMQINL